MLMFKTQCNKAFLILHLANVVLLSLLAQKSSGNDLVIPYIIIYRIPFIWHLKSFHIFLDSMKSSMMSLALNINTC